MNNTGYSWKLYILSPSEKEHGQGWWLLFLISSTVTQSLQKMKWIPTGGKGVHDFVFFPSIGGNIKSYHTWPCSYLTSHKLTALLTSKTTGDINCKGPEKTCWQGILWSAVCQKCKSRKGSHQLHSFSKHRLLEAPLLEAGHCAKWFLAWRSAEVMSSKQLPSSCQGELLVSSYLNKFEPAI